MAWNVKMRLNDQSEMISKQAVFEDDPCSQTL